MTEQILEDIYGNEIIFITNENGSTLSMLKSVWDEQQKAGELGGTLS